MQQTKDSPRGGQAQAAEKKRLLAIFEPALRAAADAMAIGAEAVLFTPDGTLYLIRREAETTFRARELENHDEAADAVLRWQDEDRAAEAVT